MTPMPDPGRMSTNYRSVARSRWPGAVVVGNEPFAVISRCRRLLVTLYPSKGFAAEEKRRLDSAGCGHPCWGQHSTEDLS